ncbi:hypothetical protein DIS24_g3079 [Lasiodiplodia hormozganensis]|uniref:Uncharacterized protein n=1 Tax=Lasiodiplodia hormozganensis TaxID=869390 RepID=A0AA39YY35_9PEZI|nr:hypothetical protein DIS24_g3079 [Lasiodiplodia hormozganensis]
MIVFCLNLVDLGLVLSFQLPDDRKDTAQLSIPPTHQKLLITPKPGLLKPPFSSAANSNANPAAPLVAAKRKIVLMGSTPAEVSSLQASVWHATAQHAACASRRYAVWWPPTSSTRPTAAAAATSMRDSVPLMSFSARYALDGVLWDIGPFLSSPLGRLFKNALPPLALAMYGALTSVEGESWWDAVIALPIHLLSLLVSHSLFTQFFSVDLLCVPFAAWTKFKRGLRIIGQVLFTTKSDTTIAPLGASKPSITTAFGEATVAWSTNKCQVTLPGWPAFAAFIDCNSTRRTRAWFRRRERRRSLEGGMDHPLSQERGLPQHRHQASRPVQAEARDREHGRVVTMTSTGAMNLIVSVDSNGIEIGDMIVPLH